MILFQLLRAAGICAFASTASVLADDSGGAVLPRGEGGGSGTAITLLDFSPGGKDRRRQLGDSGVVGFLKAERGLKRGDARDLKGADAFANSAGVGPGGDAAPHGGKDPRPQMAGVRDTAGSEEEVIIGRRLEAPECSEGYIQCLNGWEVADGSTSLPCRVACNGDCCDDGGGTTACAGFTGFVCKDGSCSGINSCGYANVGYIANSCKDTNSCYRAGYSDDMHSCCNTDSECKEVTTLPTDCSPPSQAPPPSPLNSWTINFVTLGANFSASNDNEHLSLTYSVSTNRTIVTKLYADGCVGAPEEDRATLNTTEGVIIMTDDLAPVIFTSSEPISTLSIDYDINKTLITSSDFWNNETNKIELCQVVQLTEDNPNAEIAEDYLVITEDIRNITITFDLSANFTAIVGLDAGTISSEEETTSVDGYIKAFHCDEGENELFGAKLVPNEQFNVCITSEDNDVEIAEVDSMTIKGSNSAGDSELAVIGDPDGSVLIPAITTKEHTSATTVLIKTRVPINQFDYEATDAKIEVIGSLTTKLKGSRGRKLKLDDGVAGDVGTNRKLQGDASKEEATFDLTIKLGPGVSGNEEGITMNSALSVAAGSSIAGFIVFFASAFTFW